MPFMQVGVMKEQSLLGPMEECREGMETSWTGLSVCPTAMVPGACCPTDNSWRLSCSTGWQGPKSGQVLQLKQYGPPAVQVCGLPNPLSLVCVARVSKPRLTDWSWESRQGVSLHQSMIKLWPAAASTRWKELGVSTFQCFLTSYSFFTLLQQALRLHTARAIHWQPPSCYKIHTGSESSPVWIPEPEGRFIQFLGM